VKKHPTEESWADAAWALARGAGRIGKGAPGTARTCFALAVLALLAAAAAAQEDEPAEPGELEEMVVTATRTERPLLNVPGSVTVIGLDEIAEIGGADIGDVIRDVEGVDVLKYGGAGSTTTAHLRGTAGVHALVLVDGRIENSPSLGSADLSALSPAFVERVEIVRGPASALYGAGAIGGVIQVFTREVPAEPINEAYVFGGSFETVGGSFLTGAPFGLGGGLLGIHAIRTDGHRANSDFERQELFGKLGFGDETTGRTVITLGLSDSRAGWPGPEPASVPSDRSETQRVFGNDEVSSLVDFGRSARGYVQADYRRADFRARASIDRREEEPRQEWMQWDFGDSSYHHIVQENSLETTKPELEAIMVWRPSPGLKILAGGGFGYDRLGVATTESDLDAPSVTASQRVDERTTGSVWGQVELGEGPWQGVIGVRWDEPSDYDGKASGRFLGAWKSGTGLRVEAGIGTAFRAPSLSDLNWPADAFTEGNPDLTPEDSFEVELGVEWRTGGADGMRLSAAVFRNEIDDLIRWQPDATDIWRPENLNHVEIRGAELSGSAPLGAGFRTSLAYTFLDAETTGARRVYADYSATDVFTFAEITQDLSYTPRHHVSFSLDWMRAAPSGTLKVGATLGWVSKVFQYYETWTDVGAVPFTEYEIAYPAKKLDAHALLGLRVAWSWSGGEVFVKADNLLDEEYARQFGYSLDDRDFPMPGRSVTAGVRVRF